MLVLLPEVSAVQQLTTKVLQSPDVRPRPLAEYPQPGDKHIRRVGELLVECRRTLRVCTGAPTDADVPLRGRFVVARVEHFVLKLDVRHELVFLDNRLEIGKDLGTWGIEARPVRLKILH